MITLELKHIVKLQYNLMDEFAAADTGERTGPYRRAIKHWLNKMTDDEKEQAQIEETVRRNMWVKDDYSFRPICDALRKLGYKIKVE